MIFAIYGTGCGHRFQPQDRRFGYVDDGWRCIYGLSRAQLDTFADDAPAPFRVWQWPLEALQRGNVA